MNESDEKGSVSDTLPFRILESLFDRSDFKEEHIIFDC